MQVRPGDITPLGCFCMEKCMVLNNRSKLDKWYANNCTEYGILWDPTPQDGARTELNVPRKITLPQKVTKLLHNSIGR